MSHDISKKKDNKQETLFPYGLVIYMIFRDDDNQLNEREKKQDR